MKTGDMTIWGRVDHVEKMGDGVFLVSTPSHGGVVLDQKHWDKVPAEVLETKINPVGAQYWEEDCQAQWVLQFLGYEKIDEGSLKACLFTNPEWLKSLPLSPVHLAYVGPRLPLYTALRKVWFAILDRHCEPISSERDHVLVRLYGERDSLMEEIKAMDALIEGVD